MHKLVNQVRPYEWGSTTAIPRLLGVPPDGRPQAELWLGAHPGASSALRTDAGPVELRDAIAEAPGAILGERTLARFGARLPYLMKVLAAEVPLSLQAHPDSARAHAGYEAEEAAGVPADAPQRNYPDPFHKPEMVLAVEPFEALCGFRDPAEVRVDLAGLDSELAVALRGDLAVGDPPTALRTALSRLLGLAPGDRERLVPDFVAEWAASGTGAHRATVLDVARRYPHDPGVVATLLLNRLTLRPGEALFLPAGNVHAYLRGTAVEVMASSDNVLRAGLTAKHTDPPELLEVVDFSVAPAPYVHPVAVPGRAEYRPGVPDFALAVAGPGRLDTRLAADGPSIVLVLDGAAELRAPAGEEGRLALGRGESALVPASAGEVTVAGEGHLVAATVGD